MKPDRDAEHRGRPRRAGVDHLEQVEQRGRGVADRDDRAVEPVAPQLERGGAAGGAEPAGERGHARVAQRADARRCPPAAGARVTPEATISASQRIGAPARSAVAGRRDDAGGEAEVVDQVDLPAGVDHPDRDLRDVRRQAGEVGLGADGGERPPVDLGAVADVAAVIGASSGAGTPSTRYPPSASRDGVDVRGAAARPQRRAQPESARGRPGAGRARRARRRGRRPAPSRSPAGPRTR